MRQSILSLVALPLVTNAFDNGNLRRNTQQPGLIRFPITVSEAPAGTVRHFRRQDSVEITSQSTGFFYTIDLVIGTPGQKVSLNFDTGSWELWVNPSCNNTAETAICNSFPRFTESTTLVNTNKTGQIAYGAGYAKFNYMYDYISVGGAKVNQQIFGVAYDTGVVATGIFGAGPWLLSWKSPYPHVLDSLVSQNYIQSRAFSLDLRPITNPRGSVIFGGIDTKKYTGALEKRPVVTGPDGSIRYWINVDGISVTREDGSQIPVFDQINGLVALLDSGTTLTQLPRSMVTEILKAFPSARQDPNFSYQYLVDCSVANLAGTVNFKFGNTTIKAKYDDLIWKQPQNNICVLGVSPNDSFFVLGDTFLRSAYAVYDLDNRNVYLASTADCGTNLVAIGNGPNAVPSLVGDCTSSASSQSSTTTSPQKMSTSEVTTTASPTSTSPSSTSSSTSSPASSSTVLSTSTTSPTSTSLSTTTASSTTTSLSTSTSSLTSAALSSSTASSGSSTTTTTETGTSSFSSLTSTASTTSSTSTTISTSEAQNTSKSSSTSLSTSETLRSSSSEVTSEASTTSTAAAHTTTSTPSASESTETSMTLGTSSSTIALSSSTEGLSVSKQTVASTETTVTSISPASSGSTQTTIVASNTAKPTGGASSVSYTVGGSSRDGPDVTGMHTLPPVTVSPQSSTESATIVSSKVTVTKTFTITSCAPTVTNCPIGKLTTSIVVLDATSQLLGGGKPKPPAQPGTTAVYTLPPFMCGKGATDCSTPTALPTEVVTVMPLTTKPVAVTVDACLSCALPSVVAPPPEGQWTAVKTTLTRAQGVITIKRPPPGECLDCTQSMVTQDQSISSFAEPTDRPATNSNIDNVSSRDGTPTSTPSVVIASLAGRLQLSVRAVALAVGLALMATVGLP